MCLMVNPHLQFGVNIEARIKLPIVFLRASYCDYTIRSPTPFCNDKDLTLRHTGLSSEIRCLLDDPAHTPCRAGAARHMKRALSPRVQRTRY